MKKLVAALAALMAAGALASTASATGPLLVEEGFLCGVYTADGGLALTTNSRLTWYASGKVVLKCEAQTVNNTGTRVEFSGFLCGLGEFGTTTDSRNTIGYNGSSQLTCTGWADPSAPAVAAATAGGYGAG